MALQLTQDHAIIDNPSERNRLLEAHPNEYNIIRRDRVKGRLQPTRGLGDGKYKRMEYFHEWSGASRYQHWTPPYVTAEPEMAQHTLTAQDRFMVMATDGLFQDLTSQQVVEIVGQWLDEQDSQGHDNAASVLVDAALLHASEAKYGRLGAENNLAKILQMDSKLKRNVHDDVTVVVAFFDTPVSADPKSSSPSSVVSVSAPPTLVRLADQIRQENLQAQLKE